MKSIQVTSLVVCITVFALVGVSCEVLKDAADKIIEAESGCTQNQLGNLNEPDLPNCSKAVACCKFLKGECGDIQLFTPPESVLTACNTNETVLKELIETYQGMTDGTCPDILSEESCGEGLTKTKENYILAVDQGITGMGIEDGLSCKLIVEETVNKLNDKLGANAQFLPAACEPGTANTYVPPDITDE
jgi:hypothetical protein